MPVVKQFVAYIDEAGDEGLGKLTAVNSGQSKWLVIGGIVVSAKVDIVLPKWRDDIMAMFPAKKKRDLHFRYLSHDQKVAACEYLSDKPFGICCVCSNKITLLGTKYYQLFKQKGHLYNYLTRYLLERLTAAVRRQGDVSMEEAHLRVVFSRRGGTDYQVMRDYLILMRDGLEKIRPIRSIDWSVFDPADIRVENHIHWAGLQLADVVTSATAAALEPNCYGHYEPRYANSLAQRFLTAKGAILDTGLVLIPPIGKCPLDSAQRDFAVSLKEKRQAPGP